MTEGPVCSIFQELEKERKRETSAEGVFSEFLLGLSTLNAMARSLARPRI